MAFEPQLLAPIEGGGLVEYYKPWLTGREAFPRLEDAYCWRGTIKKREGFVKLGLNPLPAGPVMGLTTFITPSTGQGRLIAFNQTNAYRFDDPLNDFVDVSFFGDGSAVTWTGTDLDYFYYCNYANSMWVTNFVDPIRFFNGNNVAGWNTQKPLVNSTDRLETCQLILPYRGRLVALNTIENSVPYRQRARWVQIGTPYVATDGSAPAVVRPANYAEDNDAWRDDIPGKGGFIDADTSERIVGAAILHDTLVVFFQRSTWILSYTGNEVLPFLWKRINTQYGADSTFSVVPFGEGIFSFSRYGFISADTNGVKRIDEKIPDQSFRNINLGENIKQLQRVHGIRDFYRQTVYWAYPDAQNNSDFPDRVLAYNYIDGTYARFNQSFTCFGNYQTFRDVTWAQLNVPRQDQWNNHGEPWNSPGTQENFPQIVAGDESGYVYIVYDIIGNNSDFNPDSGEYVNFGFVIDTKFLNPYIDKGLRCRLQYVDIYCDSTPFGRITCELYVDDNMATPVKTVEVSTELVGPNAKYVRVYLGAIARVHRIRLTLNADQIEDDDTGKSDFIIQGLVFWTRAEGRLKR